MRVEGSKAHQRMIPVRLIRWTGRTSDVLVRSILAPVLLARPSMLRVPWVLVLMVLIGLYW